MSLSHRTHNRITHTQQQTAHDNFFLARKNTVYEFCIGKPAIEQREKNVREKKCREKLHMEKA